jgi:molybdate transport system regulatory protein
MTPAFEVRNKIWFQVEGKHIFGTGMARLLSAVDETGSLVSAARREKMSYRQAWNRIKTAEEHLGARLLASRAGGAGGGGSMLTPEAREMLALFQELMDSVVPFTDRQFQHFSLQNKGCDREQQ